MSSSDHPPGTVHLETSSKQHALRSPEPSSDPNDPLNWSRKRKILHVVILALYTLITFASNTVSIPLYSDMRRTIGYAQDVLDESYAANSAALALGVIIFVPFALAFGRRIIYILTLLTTLGGIIWSAASQTTGDVIGSNILLGLAGSANESLWQMTVTDLFFVHQRGAANALYLTMVMTGNFIAPVISGFIARAQGWRYSFWWTAVIIAVVLVLMIFLLEESKFNRNLAIKDIGTKPEQHTDILEEENGSFSDIALERSASSASKSDSVTIDHSIQMRTYWQRHSLFGSASKYTLKTFLPLFYRPFVVLAQFPAILCGAFVYGFYISAMNILAVTQTTLYSKPPYYFGAIGVGEMNIAPAIGAVVGSAFGGPLVDKAIIYFARKNKGYYEPEMRLWLVGFPAAFMTAGILLYGLTIAQGMPWIINAVGSGFMGIGLGGAGDMLLAYVQDSYGKIIGIAFIGAVFLTNVMTMIFVFTLAPWQRGMGVYGMFALLGGISVAISLVTVLIVLYGKQWRKKTAIKYEKLAQT